MSVSGIKAVVLNSKGSLDNFHLGTIEKPKVEPNQLLIKVHSVAINPVDWKMALYGFLIQSFPIVLGCDIAGVVEEVGHEVKGFSKGDEICGYTKLGTPGCGGFAEYCVIPEDMVIRKPPTFSFEQASTVPVGIETACLGLYHNLKLPLPANHSASDASPFILIWGASSSVGAYAVQLASLSGYQVIAVCSSKNFGYVKSLGTHVHTADYNSPTLEDDVAKILGNQKLHHVLDCIGSDSANKGVHLLSKHNEPSAIACTAGNPATVPGHVNASGVQLGMAYSDATLRAFLVSFVAELNKDLIKKIKPNQVHKVEHGLAGVVDGLKLSQQGKVSAAKLVVNVHETK
jgi:NADPH:quinone reductase-like Zn-dependent oxidoreductase